MKSYILKSLACVLLAILIINAISAISYSAGSNNFDLTPYGNDATASDSKVVNTTQKLAGVVVGVVRIVGTGVALIMITVVAMKYMLAAPGDRADIKKTSIQYVVGAIVVFGSAQILGLIVKIAPGLFSEGTGGEGGAGGDGGGI